MTNLELKTSAFNNQNRGVSKNSKTGINGVTVKYNEFGKMQGYCVNWRENRERKSKCFAISKHGSKDEALAKAVAFRETIEDEIDIQSRRRILARLAAANNEEGSTSSSSSKRKRDDDDIDEDDDEKADGARPLKRQRTLEEGIANVK